MQGGVGAEADVQAAEAQFAAAHKALLKTPGLQFEFKSGNETPRPREPSWLDGLDEFVTAAGPVLEVLFWGGLIIGGLFVVYFILREFAPDSWFRRNRIVTEVTDWRPEAAKAQATADLRGELAQLTVGAASAVVNKNLDAAAQTQLIEDYINSVGSK